MTCKGICIRHKAQKPVGSGRYALGQRRCQICEIFINWVGLWCPCCGYRLRTKPRNLKYKDKLRTRKQLEETNKSLLSLQPVDNITTPIPLENTITTVWGTTNKETKNNK